MKVYEIFWTKITIYKDFKGNILLSTSTESLKYIKKVDLKKGTIFYSVL